MRNVETYGPSRLWENHRWLVSCSYQFHSMVCWYLRPRNPSYILKYLAWFARAPSFSSAPRRSFCHCLQALHTGSTVDFQTPLLLVYASCWLELSSFSQISRLRQLWQQAGSTTFTVPKQSCRVDPLAEKALKLITTEAQTAWATWYQKQITRVKPRLFRWSRRWAAHLSHRRWSIRLPLRKRYPDIASTKPWFAILHTTRMIQNACAILKSLKFIKNCLLWNAPPFHMPDNYFPKIQSIVGLFYPFLPTLYWLL